MASISITLGKPNKIGQKVVYFRIINKANSAYIKTHITADKSEYAGTMIRNKNLKLQVEREIIPYRELLLKYEPIFNEKSAQEICTTLQALMTKNAEQEIGLNDIDDDESKGEFKLDFIDFYRRYAEKKTRGTKTSYEYSMNSLVTYLSIGGKSSIDINDLSKAWVMRYVEWMRSRGTGDRGVELIISNHRAVHNEAKRLYNDDDDEEPNIKRSPFDAAMREVRIPTSKKSMIEKRALPASTIKYMYELETTGSDRADSSKDAFLLSFCLCGMNAADLYELKELDSMGRVDYYRQKTKERSGEMSHIVVEIPSIIRPIHEKHLSKRDLPYETTKKVWEFAEKFSSTNTFSASLNKGLKVVARAMAHKYAEGHNITEDEAYDALQLPKDLQFYAARHSWATIAANDCQISIDVVDQALCHAGNSVAERSYIKRDFSLVNNANAKVIDFVFGNK